MQNAQDHERLRRHHKAAAQYLDISGSIIATLNVEGRIGFINSVGLRLLGSDEDALVGRDWFEAVVAEPCRALARRHFQARVADPESPAVPADDAPHSGAVEPYENEIVTASGAHLCVRWTDALIFDDEGHCVGVQLCGADMTEHRRVEAALRESTARLQDFTEVASDWLWEMDAQLRVSYLTSGMSRILGIPTERLLGRTRAEFAARDEMTAQTQKKWDAHFEDLKQHRSFRDFEYQAAKADGSSISLRVSGKPIYDAQGVFQGYRGTGRDVTAEVLAQQQATRAQRLLMNTIENVPTMMVLFDDEERFVLCNQAYREALSSIDDLLKPGVTFEEISRVSAERGLVEQYKDNPQGWVDVRLARFRNPGDPVVHRQLDGRWVMTTDHRTTDGGTLIMRTDITALKKAEDDLRVKEETLHTFLDAMTDPAAMVDLNAVFIVANRAMAQRYGVEPNALIGKPMFKTPPTEVGRRRRAWMDEVVKTGQPMRKTDHYEDQWNDIILNPVFDAQGNVIQVALVSRDLSQEIKKDALLRKMSQATEQSADLVLITDVQGRIEYVNHTFTDTTGYTFEEVVGQNPRLLSSGDTPAEVYSDLWNTVLGGETWRGEIKDRRKDGTFFWSAVTITPIHDANGQIVNFVSSHVDITDRKTTEHALRDAMLRTEIANRAKGELLANMSHELRTPLNAIIGFSSMMNEGVFGPMENPQYDEYAQIINNSACHLLDIINDILDVSAIEAGKLSLHEEVFSVRDVVSSTLLLIEHRANEGDVRINYAVAPVESCLFADARRFKQILLNLVSNAVKFTPARGVVSVDYRIDDEGRPVLTVTDTGIGMDAEGIAVALTQFGQADSGHTRKYEGTGLGLPLTLGLVEMHGGTMNIQSEPGQGTTVSVRLPQTRLALIA